MTVFLLFELMGLFVKSTAAVFDPPGRKLPQQTGTEASLQPVGVSWSTWLENGAANVCCAVPNSC